MRILHVRFKNLNSLVGEWEINFAHPAFSSDGIFAITGPTGAGKTTILDAICLALYGRTPRLEKIGESGNEIMSRQTAECFAEVTFETPLGQFRCHWSHYRARKKPDGKLQKPKHEISNAQSGEIFESKIRGVAEQIEKTTGMDFDRFTRTMLLAQGGFAAFLQASPDDRGPILEQITGTQIYSDISIRVHQKRGDEKKALELLEAQYAGIKLLTPEEESVMTSQIESYNSDIQILQSQLEQERQAKGWLEGIQKLQEDVANFGTQYQKILSDIEIFKPEQFQLERAKQALELAVNHTELMSLRTQQAKNKSHLLENQTKYAQRVEDEYPKAKALHNTASQELEEKKENQTKMLSIIRRVRDLDSRLAEKNAPIQAQSDLLEKLSKEGETLKSNYDHDIQLLQNTLGNIEKLTVFFSENAVDEGLSEQLTGIEKQLEMFQESLKAHQKLQEKKQEAEKQAEEKHHIWSEKTEEYQLQKLDLERKIAQLESKNKILKEILAGKEQSDWREKLEIFKNNQIKLDHLFSAFNKVNEFQKREKQLEDTKIELVLNQKDLIQDIQKHSDEKAKIDEKIQLLETQLLLLQKIQSLEEHRNQLQEGEPCLLCGSKEHPYANETPPLPNQTLQELNQEKKKLEAISEMLTQLMIKEAKIKKDIEQTESKLKENLEHSEIEKKLLSKLSSELNLVLSEQTEESIIKLTEEASKNSQHVRLVIQKFEELEKEIKPEQEALNLASDELKNLAISLNDASNKKGFAHRTFEDIKNNFIESEQIIQSKQDELLQIVMPYGFKEIPLDSVKIIIQTLSQRRDRWQAKLSEQSALESQRSRLEIHTQNIFKQLENSQNEIQENKKIYEKLTDERKILLQQRQDLFGDQNTEQLEEQITSGIKKAEDHLSETSKKCDRIQFEINKLNLDIENTTQLIQSQEPQLNQGEHDFLMRLAQTGFKDEIDYQAACLPEETRKILHDKALSLSNKKNQLEALLQNKKELLKLEQEKQLTTQSFDELKRNVHDHEIQLKNLQEQLGAGQQKLKDNHQSRQEQQMRSQQIDAQKKECLRWENLHNLIGSSDGKKYRNFAQGLTFEMMVGHANRQLQKLTDRYLLIRDETQPLELNVIDNYQAGEIRSTKNLSGGEGFIISLSLALGLSNMASKKVRVDSLFLDEGFGTLDDEALDIALETLSSLRQEGKLIGVISHVPALKERINTQIKIQPQTGGRSVISGTGCGRGLSSIAIAENRALIF